MIEKTSILDPRIISRYRDNFVYLQEKLKVLTVEKIIRVMDSATAHYVADLEAAIKRQNSARIAKCLRDPGSDIGVLPIGSGDAAFLREHRRYEHAVSFYHQGIIDQNDENRKAIDARQRECLDKAGGKLCQTFLSNMPQGEVLNQSISLVVEEGRRLPRSSAPIGTDYFEKLISWSSRREAMRR